MRSRVTLPVFPSLPLIALSATGWTTQPDEDGRAGLWAAEEVRAEALQFADRVGGSEAISARGFANIDLAKLWQHVQAKEDFTLDGQQLASLFAGTETARRFGFSNTGWVPAYHSDGNGWAATIGAHYTPIEGGALAGINPLTGDVVGPEFSDLLGFFRNALIAAIRRGDHLLEYHGPNAG